MAKQVLLWLGLFLFGVLVGFEIAWVAGASKQDRRQSAHSAESHGSVEITLSATIDGDDRFIFTRDNAWDAHGHWQPPKEVLFNGAPWEDLSQAPKEWPELAATLDLSKATVIDRKGRDIVAFETTREGFDLYFVDSQPGAAKYSVTISIPRK